MRGTSDQQIESLVALTPEDLVPQEHPIRRIKPLADRVLQELSPTFSRMYAKGGRPSVPPELRWNSTCDRRPSMPGESEAADERRADAA